MAFYELSIANEYLHERELESEDEGYKKHLARICLEEELADREVAVFMHIAVRRRAGLSYNEILEELGGFDQLERLVGTSEAQAILSKTEEE